MITNPAAMLATLGEAQQIASMAMETTASDSGSNSKTLADLRAYVADFAHQADVVLAQLLETGKARS